jgi:Ca-activated chloride channel family protein
MRKASFALGAIAVVLVASGCSQGAAPSGGAYRPPEQHHQPTQPPPRDYPAATPYDGVTYEDPGVNPYVDTSRDRESTFALDVDTASYGIAARYIGDGNLPNPASVRVEEFVNAFEQGYLSPEEDAFAIVADGGPTPFLESGEQLLRIGIKARDVARRERPDASLTFVIDVSGSMAREDRLELVKGALRVLVDHLRRTDRVAIVVFGSDARVVLESTPADARDEILRAIDVLQPEGSTNVEAGLRLGYGLARENVVEGGINRVVLASDGVANVGLTDGGAILSTIRDDAESGIQLVSVGVGMGNYNDALMEKLADDGDGFYSYVNDLDGARKLFVEDLVGTLDAVALDAKVQVEFSPNTVRAYRLIGFENRAIKDRDFRDDVPAGAIGAGHEVTALYALRLADERARNDRLGTVSLRWTDPESRREDEIARDVNAFELSRSFEDTDSHFKFDAIVAASAEVFRGSPWIEGFRIDDVIAVADEVSEDLPQTDEVHGFLELLEDAAELR